MHLNEFQKQASQTAIYNGKGTLAGLTYTVLGLNGEAGECAEKVKKALRDSGGTMSEKKEFELAKELGDVLWYVSQAANELGMTLEAVARINLRKLKDRAARNELHGSGDDR